MSVETLKSVSHQCMSYLELMVTCSPARSNALGEKIKGSLTKPVTKILNATPFHFTLERVPRTITVYNILGTVINNVHAGNSCLVNRCSGGTKTKEKALRNVPADTLVLVDWCINTTNIDARLLQVKKDTQLADYIGGYEEGLGVPENTNQLHNVQAFDSASAIFSTTPGMHVTFQGSAGTIQFASAVQATTVVKVWLHNKQNNDYTSTGRPEHREFDLFHMYYCNLIEEANVLELRVELYRAWYALRHLDNKLVEQCRLLLDVAKPAQYRHPLQLPDAQCRNLSVGFPLQQDSA